MNNEYNQAIFNLITEYEAMTKSGRLSFLDEKVYVKLIEYYREEDQLERALEVTEHAINNHSFSSDFYIKKAQLLIESHREEQALNVLEQATIFAPGEIEIQLLKAEALTYLELYDEALHLLGRLKYDYSGEILSDICLGEALVYECLEQYERMFFALKASLEEKPNNKEALERLWLCVEISKKYEESVQLHEELLEADAYSYMAWYNLGHAQAYLGNYNQAIEAYEFSFVINEQFEEAYRDCAELCYELKYFHKALKYYLEILELFEPDGELFLYIGQCHQQLKQYNTARTYFTRAMHLDSLNDEVYFHIGECFANEGKWKSAIRAYEKAINIEDQREEYYAAIGESYYQLGEHLKAEPHFAEATKLASEQSQYWIQYASYLMETERGEKALEVLDRADQCSAGPELLYCRIACLFSIGRRKEAYYWLGEALEEDFEQHISLFELLPELKNDHEILSLIASYRLD